MVKSFRCTFPTCACVRQCVYTLPPRVLVDCQFPNCTCTVYCGHKGRAPTPASHGGRCVYCGVEMVITGDHGRQPSRDHIVPLCRGGTNTAANVAVVCKRCNEDKDDQLLKDWLDDLIWGADPRAKTVYAFLQSLERTADAA